jgi:hypothetical protein
MVPANTRLLVRKFQTNVPGGGSRLWRICNRGVIAAVGLASKGFLKLQRTVEVEGLDEFLQILEQKRDRGVITGTLNDDGADCSIESSFCVCSSGKLIIVLTTRYYGEFFPLESSPIP